MEARSRVCRGRGKSHFAACRTALICAAYVAVAWAQEEEKASAVAVAISVMLLGSISFQMSLFYLVNHSDPDMQKYSWKVISSTISIFCAVLLFQAFNGVVEWKFLGEDENSTYAFLVDMIHSFVWFIITNLVLAYISGAIGTPPKSMEIVELDMKCWAVLFAHMTGFASINAWGTMQQMEFFRQTPLTTLFVVPIACIVMMTKFKVLDVIRTHVSLADDGDVDEFEEAWDDETEEAENDVAGLCISFLLCQVLRFHIGGILPNQEGEEEGKRIFLSLPGGG